MQCSTFQRHHLYFLLEVESENPVRPAFDDGVSVVFQEAFSAVSDDDPSYSSLSVLDVQKQEQKDVKTVEISGIEIIQATQQALRERE